MLNLYYSQMSAFLLHTSQTRPFQGQSVLITGAARRIGQGIALAFAGAGADVAITYRHSTEEAADTVRQLRALGVRAEAFACDLHKPEEICSAVAAVVNWAAPTGGLSTIINNAGAYETASLDDMPVEQWDAMFATNTRAPMLVAQAALCSLRAVAVARPGSVSRVINVGSLGGIRPWATHAHYCASKAALHMLTQTMAKAWAPQIAVNCIAPGMIVTGTGPGEDHAAFATKTPMARNGKVADVAELALYLGLATPFLTGQIFTVDGGLGL
jgi:NAD(P)-dependent dehydrogenase (short-subunit alcohol dehydrogenase family)